MSNALAIVSPCSTCKNQRSTTDKDGKPACPRRFWQNQDQLVQARENSIDSPGIYPVLVASGLERSGDDSGEKLVNPVYWDDGNCIVVWIAKLEDNQAIMGGDGSTVNPDILADGFDTDYINCSLYPYAPVGNENEYFQKGALKESERLIINEAPMQQTYSDTDDSVPIAGLVNRANFFFKVPRTPVDDHQSPEGL